MSRSPRYATYPPNLQRALEATGGKAKAYSDYRALLDQADLDAVVIATPLYLHAPMSLAAFSAGKGVFCEKSLALTIEDCKAVARAASASPHVFQIGHQRLFDLRFLTALDHMRAEALGPIARDSGLLAPEPQLAATCSSDLERLITAWRLYRDPLGWPDGRAGVTICTSSTGSSTRRRASCVVWQPELLEGRSRGLRQREPRLPLHPNGVSAPCTTL
ncbi:Gfo/Idh/MocA family protein [Caulobacter segnis]